MSQVSGIGRAGSGEGDIEISKSARDGLLATPLSSPPPSR